MKPPHICLPMLLTAVLSLAAEEPWQAADLTHVSWHDAPQHAPLILVDKGEARGTICDMGNAPGAAALQEWIRATTGVELPIVKDQIVKPALVIGDCPEAREIGLDSATLPPEGLAIKTTADAVFLCGRNSGRHADGRYWAVCEFAERYLGMRWYHPRQAEDSPDIGQCFLSLPTLTVPPVWFEDAPDFRKRVIWPPVSSPWNGSGIKLTPLQTFLRAGTSWAHDLRVHQPNWQGQQELVEEHPEVFQLSQDGRRQHEVICYGNPQTLSTYLEGIQNHVSGQGPLYAPVSGKTITVSPADVELACYCDDCRALWDNQAGQYGGAAKVMATFVQKLATEVKARWPEQNFTILFLPYLNYTTAPDGFKFPGNVEIQLCGMPGMAAYKEAAIRDSEQANIDRWIAISGRPIQNWHYDVWPAHKTKAAYHYVHVVRDFYRRNRDKTVGTFINGDFNHWPRQHISLYCWLKVMWDVDFDVDAAVDTYCQRLFGAAATTMRALLAEQLTGWEDSVWPGGRLSPKGIYDVSFPPERVQKIRDLFDQARREAANDELVQARLEYYYTGALEAFFKEAEMMAGKGFRPLHIQKTGENPVLDGKLDEAAWERAPANSFVKATGADKGQPTKYASTVQALYTTSGADAGITFGFRLSEPTPQLLERKNGGHDNGNMWWDDNVEIFIDVTGKNEGEYYQFIVNPDGAYWDSKMKDTTWECPGFASKSYLGDDFWSLEVFIPYAAFPEAKVPGSGTNTVWSGNVTRHRVADQGLKSTKPRQEGSVREYQRMNTTGSSTSDNLADFAELRFIE